MSTEFSTTFVVLWQMFFLYECVCVGLHYTLTHPWGSLGRKEKRVTIFCIRAVLCASVRAKVASASLRHLGWSAYQLAAGTGPECFSQSADLDWWELEGMITRTIPRQIKVQFSRERERDEEKMEDFQTNSYKTHKKNSAIKKLWNCSEHWKNRVGVCTMCNRKRYQKNSSPSTKKNQSHSIRTP